MAHSSLREFNQKKESVEDFHERFKSYCVANGIRDDRDNTVKKKAIFIMLLGQETFAKLEVLASPTTMSDLTLDTIVLLLTQHFCPATIEIAKRFKFFKRSQKEDESATDYMGQLSKLGQTCNFGPYLETALRDQFVCSLSDTKCQRELLCDPALTAETALKKARASEVVLKETEGMQAVKEPGNSTTMIAATNVGRSTIVVCYRCGELGHCASSQPRRSTICTQW